jgi:hypothetical protein
MRGKPYPFLVHGIFNGLFSMHIAFYQWFSCMHMGGILECDKMTPGKFFSVLNSMHYSTYGTMGLDLLGKSMKTSTLSPC